jgi:hypothetical protein
MFFLKPKVLYSLKALGGWLSRFKLIRLRHISLATFAAFGGAHNQEAEVWACASHRMDTNIYIACLRQVVAFAPKVIIVACLRQLVAFAPKVIIIACLRQGFCIRKTR